MTYVALIALVVSSVLPAGIDAPPAGMTPGAVKRVACRIVSRTPGTGEPVKKIAEVDLALRIGQDRENSFAARLHTGQVLTTRVQNVRVMLPRDRFNITLLLDGNPFLRMNHLDLDIYVETAIDGQTYALHCFPAFGGPAPDTGSGP